MVIKRTIERVSGGMMMLPTVIGSIDHSYHRIAPTATMLVATSVVVTAVLTPIATALYARWVCGKVVTEPEMPLVEVE
jgi:2-keto-3-deoxygluconate permease